MTDIEHEVYHIDCRKCVSLGSLGLQGGCKKCLPREKYDRFRLRTKYFTKEYDGNNLKLLSLEPFFIDVRVDYGQDRENKLLKTYSLPTNAVVQLFEMKDNVEYLYKLRLPEMRYNFYDLKSIYKDVQDFKKTGFTGSKIVQRWYQNLGILEHLLLDEHVLEININPPEFKTPIRIVHDEFDECITNLYPSDEFLNYFVTRLRMISGRPLNKSQPQLDSEISIGEQKARVAAIVNPFSIFGIGFSVRKHRQKPWTTPLFMKNKALNSWLAGFMSFVIAHGRSFLIAGPRGSGKTALLGSFLLEILPKYRMITIEDTQELAIETYRDLGYDIVPLKVRSALLEAGMEIPFEMGLRTSLRLGDSCLILGEIRSVEAKVLYEAMRVGAMSNVVAGTIHADNPYGVYDRVVNDLGVTKGSFKVTDLIIIINQIKDPTGLKRVRRVVSVTEVLKDWEEKPEFQDLLMYNPKTDQLEPTEAFLNGKSVLLKTVLEHTQGYTDYNSVLKDIMLRAWAKDEIVKLADSRDKLEAAYVVKANVMYDKLAYTAKPLDSAKLEAEFKKRFTEELKILLTTPVGSQK
ncbi:MAG: ATPase, T2SS/T4P/T4SS family [Candidatus Woesearchaeota archaeon]